MEFIVIISIDSLFIWRYVHETVFQVVIFIGAQTDYSVRSILENIPSHHSSIPVSHSSNK